VFRLPRSLTSPVPSSPLPVRERIKGEGPFTARVFRARFKILLSEGLRLTIYGFKNSLNDAETIALASTGVSSCPRDEAEAIATCAATVNSAAVCRSIACRTLDSILVRTALSAAAVSCFSSFELAILFSLIDANSSHARRPSESRARRRRCQHTNGPVDSAS
jgi:hypothetical protein